MTTIEEETDQDLYFEVMAQLKKINGRIDTLSTELEAMKESLKSAQHTETPETEIVGYCTGCKHPLTKTESESSVCPYCQESTQYKPVKPPSGLGLL